MAKNDPGLLKKAIFTIGGISLILLGIFGIFLPVLQGILLIIGGLGLLSIGNEGVREWINDLGKRYPRQTSVFKKIKMKILHEKKSSHTYRNGELEKGAKNDG